MSKPLALIIEDDPEIAAILSISLRNEFEVESIADGNSAIARLAQVVPLLIVLDLHLPTVNGIEFVRQLRATAGRAAAIPTAIVTGDYLLEGGTAGELETLGVPLYFKPLWEEDLVRIVEQLLHPGDLPEDREIVPTSTAGL